jgi:hypothetical protein
MSDSTRQPDISFIKRISKTTIVQVNKGFKKCRKRQVQTATDDITHAYIDAFRHAVRLGFHKILTLEDDVVFVQDCEKDLRAIDNFVSHKFFSVYSLGSCAFTLPFTTKHHMIASPFLGAFQAIIWNTHAIFDLSMLTRVNREIDNHIAKALPAKFMYYKPIAKQLFTKSESQAQWINPLQSMFFKTTQFSKHLEPGWSIICLTNYLYWIVSTLFIISHLKRMRLEH